MIPEMDQSSFFYPYGGIGIFENFLGIEFSISHRTNTGAAWGMFSSYPFALLLFRIFMITGMFVYLVFYNKSMQQRCPFALILSGALGNVSDFFVYGHVVDMFHFVFWGYDYPVFNIADSLIFVGVFWLLFLSFFEQPEQTPS